MSELNLRVEFPDFYDFLDFGKANLEENKILLNASGSKSNNLHDTFEDNNKRLFDILDMSFKQWQIGVIYYDLNYLNHKKKISELENVIAMCTRNENYGLKSQQECVEFRKKWRIFSRIQMILDIVSKIDQRNDVIDILERIRKYGIDKNAITLREAFEIGFDGYLEDLDNDFAISNKDCNVQYGDPLYASIKTLKTKSPSLANVYMNNNMCPINHITVEQYLQRDRIPDDLRKKLESQPGKCCIRSLGKLFRSITKAKSFTDEFFLTKDEFKARYGDLKDVYKKNIKDLEKNLSDIKKKKSNGTDISKIEKAQYNNIKEQVSELKTSYKQIDSNGDEFMDSFDDDLKEATDNDNNSTTTEFATKMLSGLLYYSEYTFFGKSSKKKSIDDDFDEVSGMAYVSAALSGFGKGLSWVKDQIAKVLKIILKHPRTFNIITRIIIILRPIFCQKLSNWFYKNRNNVAIEDIPEYSLKIAQDELTNGSTLKNLFDVFYDMVASPVIKLIPHGKILDIFGKTWVLLCTTYFQSYCTKFFVAEGFQGWYHLIFTSKSCIQQSRVLGVLNKDYINAVDNLDDGDDNELSNRVRRYGTKIDETGKKGITSDEFEKIQRMTTLTEKDRLLLNSNNYDTETIINTSDVNVNNLQKFRRRLNDPERGDAFKKLLEGGDIDKAAIELKMTEDDLRNLQKFEKIDRERLSNISYYNDERKRTLLVEATEKDPSLQRYVDSLEKSSVSQESDAPDQQKQKQDKNEYYIDESLKDSSSPEDIKKYQKQVKKAEDSQRDQEVATKKQETAEWGEKRNKVELKKYAIQLEKEKQKKKRDIVVMPSGRTRKSRKNYVITPEKAGVEFKREKNKIKRQQGVKNRNEKVVKAAMPSGRVRRKRINLITPGQAGTEFEKNKIKLRHDTPSMEYYKPVTQKDKPSVEKLNSVLQDEL